MKVLIVCFTLLALPSVGTAHAGQFARHPTRGSRQLPAGVPDGYVFTRNGFFHASCVYVLRADESWTADNAIIGKDGTVHERMTPCTHPRFGVNGEMIAPTSKSAHLPPHSATYNGWLLGFIGGASTAASVPTGAVLTTTWQVPDAPTTIGDGEDVAFFNGLELDSTKADGFILQPVLDFNQADGSWIVESESCCFAGNDLQSTYVPVQPGDVIRGSIVPSGCDTTSGVCKSFVITTADLTNGQSALLTGVSNGLVVDSIIPAALETYGVTTCDELPANGEIVFHSAATGSNGDALPFTYTSIDCVLSACPNGGDVSQIPKTCGWGLAQSDDDFTLTFGATPHLVDGGGDIAPPADAALAVDAASVVEVESDASAAPEDAGTSSSRSKHGCATVPLGSAPSPTGLGCAVFFFALVVLQRRRST